MHGSPKSVQSAQSSTTIAGREQFDLTTALLRASYAESMDGGTEDLLAILERTGKTSEFAYNEVTVPVEIYYGSKDDRISLTSVKALAEAIPTSHLHIEEGQDHSLMTSYTCLIRVFEEIRQSALGL